jgi:hypothetical protein
MATRALADVLRYICHVANEKEYDQIGARKVIVLQDSGESLNEISLPAAIGARADPGTYSVQVRYSSGVSRSQR